MAVIEALCLVESHALTETMIFVELGACSLGPDFLYNQIYCSGLSFQGGRFGTLPL